MPYIPYTQRVEPAKKTAPVITPPVKSTGGYVPVAARTTESTGSYIPYSQRNTPEYKAKVAQSEKINTLKAESDAAMVEAKKANSFGGIVKNTLKGIPKAAGKVAGNLYDMAGQLVAPGITHEELRDKQILKDTVTGIPRAARDVVKEIVTHPVKSAQSAVGSAARGTSDFVTNAIINLTPEKFTGVEREFLREAVRENLDKVLAPEVIGKSKLSEGFHVAGGAAPYILAGGVAGELTAGASTGVKLLAEGGGFVAAGQTQLPLDATIKERAKQAMTDLVALGLFKAGDAAYRKANVVVTEGVRNAYEQYKSTPNKEAGFIKNPFADFSKSTQDTAKNIVENKVTKEEFDSQMNRSDNAENVEKFKQELKQKGLTPEEFYELATQKRESVTPNTGDRKADAREVLKNAEQNAGVDYIQKNLESSLENTKKISDDTLAGKREHFRLDNPEQLKRSIGDGVIPKDLTPDSKVKIYRASNGKITEGDHVTFDRTSAEKYAKDRQGSVIQELEVSARDLVKANGRIEEFVYAPQKPKNAPKINVPSKEVELPENLAKRGELIEQKEYLLSQHPARDLGQFSARTGEFKGGLPETTGRNGASKFGRSGDDIATERGFESSEEARASYDEYKKLKQELVELKKEFARDKQEHVRKAKDEIALQRIAERNARLEDLDVMKRKEKKAQDDRLEERKKALEEGQKNAREEFEKKQERLRVVNKAFETPGEKLGFFGKLGQALNPVKYLDSEARTIMQKWNKDLIQANLKANKEMGSFDISNAESWKVITDYQAGIKTKYTAEIKAKFDAFLKEARRRGLELNERENYLPQVYKETPAEMQAKIEKYLVEEKGMTAEEVHSYLNGKMLGEDHARRLGLNPFFVKERIFPTYEVAQKYGLTPKYTNLNQLAAHYRQTMERAIANRDLIENLSNKGKILLVESAPSSWEPINLPFSQKGYYAESRLAKMLNGIFRNEADAGFIDTAFKKVANLSRRAQEITLSAGIPRTNVNFFSMGQLVKEVTAGNFKAINSFFRANFNDRSMQWFKSKASVIEKMADQGLDVSSNISAYEKLHKNLIDKPKFTEIVGEQFDKAFNEKTFNSFMPQMQIQLFEDVYRSAIKKGMPETIAQKLAADTTRNNFGLNEYTGRSRVAEDKLSATFFAPKFREGIINTLYNTGKAGVDFARNLGGLRGQLDPTLSRNRRLLTGMVVTYGLYNVLNKQLNGYYMWDNPDNRKFALRVPGKDGNVIYIEFMPSFLAFARNIASGGIAMVQGDFNTATQKFGTVFSMPVKITSEVISNSDYFGNPIYKDTDTTGEKTLKIAKYVGLQVNHPYVKELVNQIEDKKPLYQSLTTALELPIKYGTEEKEKSSRVFDALDKQAKENAELAKLAEREYDKLKKLPADEANKRALEIYQENPDLYKKIETLTKNDQLGRTPTQRYMMQLNSENRAKFIYEELKDLETNEEKNKYLEELSSKKVLTKDTYEELSKLVNNEE